MLPELKSNKAQASKRDDLVTDPSEVQMRLLRMQMDQDNAGVEGFDDPVDVRKPTTEPPPVKQ
ncbi:hypothetical protein UFOVP375_4 [uncultured Caudovirales phage]|uniref:Uncharacterized protein n=1 Tax=uncultured Caudovirales phage TaxID=2100421 RepID=A0A6J7XLV0_9CAUD|nr:hypothetical protein UFOVP375_4 [uncultured Caudovirales phage]